MSASFERFIGVDLGGGKGKKTALAVLERRDDGVAVVGLLPRAGDAPLYDGALIAAIRARADRALLCVDAPLGLPPCLRCLVPVCPGQERCVDPAVIEMRRLGGAITDPTRDHRRGKPAITPYTQRPTEVYLRERRGIVPRETLGQGMGPLTARAMHLMRALADLFRPEENAIEVYPRATLELLRLNEPYKKRADARLRILSRMPGLSFAPGRVARGVRAERPRLRRHRLRLHRLPLGRRSAGRCPPTCRWSPRATAGSGCRPSRPARSGRRRPRIVEPRRKTAR